MKHYKGFTIIEVLIVLAIAGLILTIVFLAVPQLQRNSRNTTRRSDIGRLATAVNAFVANNNNTLPSTSTHVDTILKNVGASTLTSYTTALSSATVLATAENNKVSLITASADVPALATSGTNQVQIVTGATCDTATPGKALYTSSNTRNIVIQYTLESGTASTVTPACQNT